jgi:hypothetical protein
MQRRALKLNINWRNDGERRWRTENAESERMQAAADGAAMLGFAGNCVTLVVVL